MKRIFIIFILISTVSLFSQILTPPDGTTDPISVGDGHTMYGLRAAGMGGAHIALADDYTALWYNPARLSYVYRAEVSTALNFENVKSENTYTNNTLEATDTWTRLNQLGLVVPVPTTQGGLCFALGYNRNQSFNKVMDFSNGSDDLGFEEISGGISNFSIGGGLQISEIAALGLALDIPFGVENYTFYHRNPPDSSNSYQIIRNDWSSQLSGVSGRLGFAVIPNKMLHLGFNVEFPTYYTVDQDVIQNIEYLSNGTTDSLYTDDYSVDTYHLTTPFKFGVGLALRFPYVIASADIKYADYSQLEYNTVWLRDQNNLLQNSYSDALSYSFGVEGIIPKTGVKIRAGYCHEPLHYTAYKIEKDRNYITGGVGVLVSKTISLDLAVTYNTYERTDADMIWSEDWRVINTYFGLAYRF